MAEMAATKRPFRGDAALRLDSSIITGRTGGLSRRVERENGEVNSPVRDSEGGTVAGSVALEAGRGSPRWRLVQENCDAAGAERSEPV